MGWEEWGRLDGLALADLVRARKVTPAELVAQVAAGVARIARLDPVIEVFDDVLANPAADGPDPAGRLHGVPIFLKDLGSGLKGRRQDSGSALLAGTVLGPTDPLIANFLRAGMIPLGRSTTPEFGLTFDTVTDYRGGVRVSRNPWNLEHTPGGSSGGAGVLVASGVTPISMASDGGGSIRFPAAFCGMIGLKPSRGRVAPALARNEYVSRISVEGVVTRSVRDTAAVLDYITRRPEWRLVHPPGRARRVVSRGGAVRSPEAAHRALDRRLGPRDAHRPGGGGAGARGGARAGGAGPSCRGDRRFRHLRRGRRCGAAS